MWTKKLSKKLECDRCGKIFPIGASTYMKNKYGMDVSVEVGGHSVRPDKTIDDHNLQAKVDFCPKCYTELIDIIAGYLTGEEFAEEYDDAENETPNETDNEDENGEETEKTEDS